MEAEKDEGNIEYKLKLIDKSLSKIESVATQMRYRCKEGGSECIYHIGVDDDGTLVGVTNDEFNETLGCLKKAAEKNSYIIIPITTTIISPGLSIHELLIRENNKNTYVDIRVAIAGSVDSGKSTFLGVLTNGINDNGRGSARLSVFNYAHEVNTGRSSSIAQHILGFNSHGKETNKFSGERLTWPEIVQYSNKIVTMFDLAGHKKYLKTTIRGLTSSSPEMCIIMVSANRGILKMTKEHIFLCITLGIPFCIVITKIDMVKDKSKIMKETLSSITKLIRCTGIRRLPIKVNNFNDVGNCAKSIHTLSIVPIFKVSNVTGEGLKYITEMLNMLPKRKIQHKKSKYVEFHIDQTWTVTGVGIVVGGHLISGKIRVGDKLYLGPHNNKYNKVVVRSIQCKRVSMQSINYVSYVTICIKQLGKVSHTIRKGSVLLEDKSQLVLCHKFKANIKIIMSHSTTIKVGYEPVIHLSSIRTPVKLLEIHDMVNSRKSKSKNNCKITGSLRTGDSATVTMIFVHGAEFIKNGTRLLLCEGSTKVAGTILEIL